MTLGERIKKVRNEKNLSLRDLAANLELSASFLSQIEQGKASPSIENLKKIANSLDCKVSYLIEDEEEKKDTVLIRAKDRNVVESMDSKAKISLLTSSDIEKSMEPILYEIMPEGESGKDFYHHNGEEFVFVIEGELDVYINDDLYHLEQGDSIYFKSNQKHKFKNLSYILAEYSWQEKKKVL